MSIMDRLISTMSVVNRLSLVRKLMVIVLIPIIGLACFAVLEVNQKRAVATEMDGLAGIVSLAVDASELINALERERGFAAAMLAGDSDQAMTGFLNQRETTDELINSFRGAVGELREDDAIGGANNLVKDALDELESQRQNLGAGLVSMQVISAYSEVSNALLPTITAASEATTHSQVKSMLLSVEYLAQLKVAAGLERAALNLVFTMDFADPNMVMAVVELVGRQASFEELFLAHGHNKDVERYRVEMSNEAHQDFTELRSAAREGMDAEELGIDPQRWWRASSQRIDALSEVSALVAKRTREQMSHLRSGARTAAWTASFLAAVAILTAVLLSGATARNLGRSLTTATTTTQDTVNQIVSSVEQLSASTAETSTAVTLTSTTVDELRQTSVSAAAKAGATSETAEGSKAASDRALEAVGQGIEAMLSIREGVEGIARNIVQLSEKTLRIGEIVESVTAIADQSNLLAVNASIEAANAGEQGRGFAVVANEVKALAGRSKEAAGEIRTMLSEIEQSSNSAVMITEQGVQRVEQGSELIGGLGEVIQTLARVIEEGADATSQIALTAEQQLAGIEQITEALKSVEGASTDNAAGAEQLARAAEQVQAVSGQIAEIVQGRAKNTAIKRRRRS